MGDPAYSRSSLSVNRKYMEYFVPTVLTAMASNIALIVDSIVSGNLLGSRALAAINLISPISQLCSSLAVLFGSGAAVLIASAKGENDKAKADQTFTASVVSVVVVTAALVAGLLPLVGAICALLTPDPELQTLVNDYFTPFIWGIPLHLGLAFSGHCIRTDGSPNFASALIIISNAINLCMDLVYMGLLKMGIQGAALATITGDLVAFVIMLFYFLLKKNQVRFDRAFLLHPWELLRCAGTLMVTGASGALGMMLVSVRMQFIITLVQKSAGSAALVSNSICSSSNIFISMFITGASQTMIPIIGVFMGERDYVGVRYTFRRGFKILMAAGLATMAAFLLFTRPIIRLFGVTAAADVENAVSAMRINAISFPFFALSCLLLYYFMATRKKMLSTTISILHGAVMPIIFSAVLSELWGINGVWASFAASYATTIGITYVMTLVVRWKTPDYKSFYLIPERDEGELASLSLKASRQGAAGVSAWLSASLSACGVEKSAANRAAVAVEEAVVEIADRQDGKDNTLIDIRLQRTEDGICIFVRDNGKAYDPEQPQQEGGFTSLEMLRAVSRSVEFSNVIGFNRIMIRI